MGLGRYGIGLIGKCMVLVQSGTFYYIWRRTFHTLFSEDVGEH
jgi:hypothetical protein